MLVLQKYGGREAAGVLIPYPLVQTSSERCCRLQILLYGRVAVFTFSLSSSSLMTAVFLASLIFRRLSGPVVMVWTLEHPSLRAVFFLVDFSL